MNVVNIAEFASTEQIKKDLIFWANLRTETLRRCYAMEGYEALPLAEKNKIYDRTKRQVEEEWKK